jgi:ABC-type lipoprotein release transport system permease subunit
MGIVERIGQLGMLRCVGLTRRQLAGLVAMELLPMGIVGILLGLPVGIGLTRLGASFIPQYVQGVAISRWGIGLAIAGGAITIGLSAIILIVQVGRVPPLAAVNPEARPSRRRVTVVAAVIGVALLLLHDYIIGHTATGAWFEPLRLFITVASLYGGYVLIAPALILLVGSGVVSLVAPLLRLKRRLAQDQISRAPWRSAGVCWMLMVGLSLIVYIAARGEGVVAAWDFPKSLPETFVWSLSRVPVSTQEAVRRLEGVGEFTVVTDFPCRIHLPWRSGAKQPAGGPWGGAVVQGTFVAGELDRFLAMTKLAFLEGNLADAVARLRQGGALLIPPEASNLLGLHVGDKLDVRVGQRQASFEVAGVVQSPALDIAVTYFQADSYMMQAAAASVLGTLSDAERCFGIKDLSMYMLNVSIPPAPRPAAFDSDEPPSLESRPFFQSVLDWQESLPNEQAVLAEVAPQIRARLADRSSPLDRLAARTLQRFRSVVAQLSDQWEENSPQHRWEMFREQLVLRNVAYTIGRPNAMVGSLRRLKQQIDREIRDVCLLMSAMPAVALAVASLGVANLMMVSVSVRTRQIAVLRAVGATKSQIVRLVFTEAITLGILGCFAGVALGIHSSDSASQITGQVVGVAFPLVVPWWHITVGASLTVGVCILASIGPARHAARNNIIDAMQVG